VRVLAAHEPVEILCASETVLASAEEAMTAHGVRRDRVRLHVVPTDRVWLRDSGPTGVFDARGSLVLLSWGFSAWAKYDNFQRDQQVGRAIAGITGRPVEEPRRHDNGGPVILEGGEHRGQRPRRPARD
jgi:agmatine deiminase